MFSRLKIFYLLCLTSCFASRQDQIISESFEENVVVVPQVKKVCGENMVEIEGDYCPQVEEVCLKWIDADKKDPLRCAEFKNPSRCLSKTKVHMHFCMAKFEYPGIEGTYPLVGMNYEEAKALASKDGNRLCTTEEFDFACEGAEIHPYGYGDGFHRDSSICNIDKPWIDWKKFPQSSWNNRDVGLYQGVRSDSNSLCKTWAGIYNINGNVDEILDSEKSKNAILAGGYWSVVRNRCRPRTRSHGKNGYSFYQLGFRECKNVYQ